MKKLLTVAMIMASTSAMAAGGAAKWGYEGELAAENWGTLAPEYSTCSTGQFQSPIDINASFSADVTDLDIKYDETAYKLTDTGHALKASFEEGNGFTAEGHNYKLLQLHFHTPSEYTIGGKQSPMVVHLVHQNEAGQLGVIGVMIDEGEANPAIEGLWSSIPEKTGDVLQIDEALDLQALLPADRSFYRFMGSLTTPPCSEGVNWFFMKNPITASKEQIAAHVAKWKHNARPLQKKGHRLIIDAK